MMETLEKITEEDFEMFEMEMNREIENYINEFNEFKYTINRTMILLSQLKQKFK